MADISGPFDEANEADVLEQAQPAGDADPLSAAPETWHDRADEADVLEQSAVASDEDEDYPRDPG